MRIGVEVLLDDRRDLLKGRRIGILAHAASVDSSGSHTVDRISREGGGEVTALFGPEHGIATKAQDMEPVGSCVDPDSRIPVYSLYGNSLESLKPTPEMLSKIDILVVDLQDIGSRYYTYVWTACLAAEACAEEGKRVVICDRPNPIGGLNVEGGPIEPGFESFVGLHSIPVRHGMTIGEIVHLVNDNQPERADLEVLRIEGWGRGMAWPSTGFKWVNPSPNMRSYTAALLYPGMCLLEGTNMSEGRGTDTPFEIVGAPYVNSEELIDAFAALSLPGVHLAPTSFIPVMQKWVGKMCDGVRFVVESAEEFRPYLTGLAFVWLLKKLYGERGFDWRKDPYEFVTNRPAIDLLTGCDCFRSRIDELTLGDIEAISITPPDMSNIRRANLLY
ncbi:MAG TPA: DUF1343 domain-containing protein [bacterium]|nr:DUF1343 domain-containing protein [bacterium]